MRKKKKAPQVYVVPAKGKNGEIPSSHFEPPEEASRLYGLEAVFTGPGSFGERMDLIRKLIPSTN